MSSHTDANSRAEGSVAAFLDSKMGIRGGSYRPAENSAFKCRNLNGPSQQRNQYNTVTDTPSSPVQVNVTTAALVSRSPEADSLQSDDKGQHDVSPNAAKNLAAGSISATLPQQDQFEHGLPQESAVDTPSISLFSVARRSNSGPILAQVERSPKNHGTWPRETTRRSSRWTILPPLGFRRLWGNK